jgi:hypothetical protein
VSEHVAYWADHHVFGPHAWKFFGLRGLSVEVRFGEPIPTEGVENRKALAEEAHRRVVALMGFEPEPEPELMVQGAELDSGS